MRTSPRCTWTSWRASPPAGRSCRWTISLEALELSEDDFTPAVWQGGVLPGAALRHPARHVHRRAVLEHRAANRRQGSTIGTDHERRVRRPRLQALQSSGVENPFWVSPDNWQIFVSLLGQFGGSLYSEDLTTVAFGDDAGSRR